MITNAPCPGCPVLAICRLNDTIQCDLLGQYMTNVNRDNRTSLRDSLNAEMIIWNSTSNIFTFVRDKQLADDLRRSGKQ